MYKAIIFDMDNTLLNYSASELQSMKRTLSEFGLLGESFGWDKFWSCFVPINTVYWVERNERKLDSLTLLELSFRDTLRKLQGDASLASSLASTYWRLFCNTCHLEPGAVELLDGLNPSHKLAIITNGMSESQYKRLEIGGIRHYFDVLVISDEAGCQKPDPAIFQIALEQLHTTSTEVLFVGDSLTDDYHGAWTAGIDFCLYNPRKIEVEQHIRPKFMIHDLRQLLDVLE